MKSLAVRVLGDFVVDGIEPRQLGSRKARLLLRLLALGRGRPVPGPVLVDALWGESAPANPADQLAVLVSRLRTVIGRERIEHGDGGYRLRYDWLDADELGALVADLDERQVSGNVIGAVSTARVALSLVRGELSQGADVLGDWAQGQLAELERLVAHTRRAGATAMLRAGHRLEAAELASASLARDPYDEHAARCLMQAYAADGRGASALVVYAELRERLAEDLGSDPAAETEAVHHAVLRGERFEASTTDVERPLLVGRDVQLKRLDELAERARQGVRSIVVIEGEAGIGKTSLLRAWSAGRAREGDLVLAADCTPLDRSVTLDAILIAVEKVLQGLGTEEVAEVLASDAELLAPLLGRGTAERAAMSLGDGVLGLSTLYAALLRVIRQLARIAPLVLIVDDAHLAGPALGEWLEFIGRRNAPVLVVAAVRVGAGERLPANCILRLGVLDRDSASTLVGGDRVDALYALSGGHPLFLTQLAATPDAERLPESLVEAVCNICDALGAGGATLRAAAVIGPRLDLDLLAGVLGKPVVELLEHAEAALARQLLVDDAGVFWFRHELVRSALSAGTRASRTAFLHRQAGRLLAQRPGADPVDVAEQARLGGDVVLAGRSLLTAASRASQRFDHSTAERLIDEALELDATAEAWLQRARIRTILGRYDEAGLDVESALTGGAGAAALEVGAWASYYDRRFAVAEQFAMDGQFAATDPDIRARCLTVGGRTRHAAGDLRGAEELLVGAVEVAGGADRVAASAWLGVLRAHQSRVPDALRLLSPAARSISGVEHTSATLHALLFTGHALALAGRPAEALTSFARYTDEVERRQVPRYDGRGVNFAGWVLRNVGATAHGVDLHQQALDVADARGTVEVTVAAHEDLAEAALADGELDEARAHLEAAQDSLKGDLVFGWRLAMKLQYLSARLALDSGDPAQALGLALALDDDATRIEVPRYATIARLLATRASAELGEPISLDVVEHELGRLERAVGVEAWWVTGELAAALRVPKWVERAADGARQLASHAGEHADGLRAAAAPRLELWRSAALSSQRARPGG